MSAIVKSSVPTESAGTPPKTKHLAQLDLSRRWAMSPRTLERWRWLQLGPPYVKVGNRVVYRLADIEAFEAANTHLRAPPQGTPHLPCAKPLTQGGE